jgi:hypothetical protein
MFVADRWYRLRIRPELVPTSRPNRCGAGRCDRPLGLGERKGSGTDVFGEHAELFGGILQTRRSPPEWGCSGRSTPEWQV